MKNSIFKILVALSALLIGAASAQAQTMEERVEALEEKSILDSFEFGGMFSTKFQNTVTDLNSTERKYNYWTMRGHLNINAEVNDRINFYSQLGISKIFNNFIQNNYKTSAGTTTSGSAPLSSSNAYNQDKAFFKRFYIDYQMTDKLTMSLGRLPTGGGNPSNMHDGVARQSTYPQFAYNAQFDGLALTYKLNDNMRLRFINTPFQNSSNATIGSEVYRGDKVGSGAPAAEEEVEEHIDFTAYQFDWTTSFGWTRNFNLVYQHVNSSSVVFDQNLLGAAYIQALETSYSINWHTLYIEMLGLGNTNFDLALSALQSGVKINNLGGAGVTDKTVTNSHIGMKYNFGSNHLGLEYWNIPRYSSYFDSDSEWFDAQYARQGKHYHIYYTMRKYGNTAFRVGYVNSDQEYKSIFALGTAEKKTYKTAYANMRVDF